MSFFESELVQQEMKDISKLQEKVYGNVFIFPSLDREGKLRHINDLETLMEKQKILYVRLALSDDSDAALMRTRIQDSATLMGLPENVDMNALFANMTQLVQNLKQELARETN